ncbi:hypothetical protein L228DRAFT_259468 [Xylona heveae TC161]|uniref:Uncharacterized protein n=1 Tax=Xylona heveae (strain CBS 132557 / TC161) TaxID=1328760 RepID=A0A165I1C2_XYLHT|nr:hypothetical protein L228DRAFT_259468 [Xylona heveae TC161]KZF24218.1 hypothetical protein L228DRAFT_259468 [Xylona heveae TC161]
MTNRPVYHWYRVLDTRPTNPINRLGAAIEERGVAFGSQSEKHREQLKRPKAEKTTQPLGPSRRKRKNHSGKGTGKRTGKVSKEPKKEKKVEQSGTGTEEPNRQGLGRCGSLQPAAWQGGCVDGQGVSSTDRRTSEQRTANNEQRTLELERTRRKKNKGKAETHYCGSGTQTTPTPVDVRSAKTGEQGELQSRVGRGRYSDGTLLCNGGTTTVFNIGRSPFTVGSWRFQDLVEWTG